ncbi:MAG: hypothetical protein H6R16_2028 [Proteobacteria bacterium]|nr:hypothetical protein [Pseudomonadota bacterium]
MSCRRDADFRGRLKGAWCLLKVLRLDTFQSSEQSGLFIKARVHFQLGFLCSPCSGRYRQTTGQRFQVSLAPRGQSAVHPSCPRLHGSASFCPPLHGRNGNLAGPRRRTSARRSRRQRVGERRRSANHRPPLRFHQPGNHAPSVSQAEGHAAIGLAPGVRRELRERFRRINSTHAPRCGQSDSNKADAQRSSEAMLCAFIPGIKPV